MPSEAGEAAGLKAPEGGSPSTLCTPTLLPWVETPQSVQLIKKLCGFPLGWESNSQKWTGTAALQQPEETNKPLKMEKFKNESSTGITLLANLRWTSASSWRLFFS